MARGTDHASDTDRSTAPSASPPPTNTVAANDVQDEIPPLSSSTPPSMQFSQATSMSKQEWTQDTPLSAAQTTTDLSRWEGVAASSMAADSSSRTVLPPRPSCRWRWRWRGKQIGTKNHVPSPPPNRRTRSRTKSKPHEHCAVGVMVYGSVFSDRHRCSSSLCVDQQSNCTSSGNDTTNTNNNNTNSHSPYPMMHPFHPLQTWMRFTLLALLTWMALRTTYGLDTMN